MPHVILLSIPNLRSQDISHMPRLAALVGEGGRASLAPSFPAVTCPVQANMTTGAPPSEHGVVANGFYWREKQEVEMWTAWNECIQRPQIWDRLHEIDPNLTSAVWFPLHSKGCGADYICTPAPIHNPDGSESLWCYTRPEPLYGELRDALGHFPLQHFWGPAANIKSTEWIAESAILGAEKFKPNFFYIYLPHLDYAAQKHGPDSKEALLAVEDLDRVIGRLVEGINSALGKSEPPTWVVASEYTISPVDHILYPNRILREAGLLEVRQEEDGELIDFDNSAAWALVDHQFSYIFVRDADAGVIGRVAELFEGQEGVAEVLIGDDLAQHGLNHPRSGEVVLVSTPNSWQAYYWWLDDAGAPAFAHSVDIHRKPGYDPVELHFDPTTKRIPLDATLVKGSHGAPPNGDSDDGAGGAILLCSQPGVLERSSYRDLDVAEMVLRQFSSEES